MCIPFSPTESFPDSQGDGDKENGCSVTPPCCFTIGGRGECQSQTVCKDGLCVAFHALETHKASTSLFR